MGWFDDQIRERIEQDSKQMEKSYQALASVVDSGIEIEQAQLEINSALDQIAKYFGVEKKKIPARIKDEEEKLEWQFRSSGIMWRKVRLSSGWYKNFSGVLLAYTNKGEPVALIPDRWDHYSYYLFSKNEKIDLNENSAKQISNKAWLFYRGFPHKPLTFKDLVIFTLESFSKKDQISVLVLGLFITLLGFVTPYVTEMLFAQVIPSGQSVFLATFMILLMGTALSTFLFRVLKGIYVSRIEQSIVWKLKGAIYARLLSLPVQFFRQFRSGDLATRINSLDSLTENILNVILGVGMTALFSLIYIVQIFTIVPELAFPAIVALLIQVAAGLLVIWGNVRILNNTLKSSAKLDGLVYSLFSGIQKIKLAGAEKRAFNRWVKLYQKNAMASYNPGLMVYFGTALSSSASVLGLLIIYAFAADSVSLSQFVSFNAVYALLAGAFISLMHTASSLASIKPVLDLNRSFFEAEPEIEEHKEQLRRLSGTIELNNVSFQYSDNGPKILDDLSLKINRGQYVAIVGKTGCGKSTLMRLLLGFEKPQSGAIYYDGKDLEKLDKPTLRKKIGVVMQNGSLFQGSIFENIAISNPQMTLKEAWKAAETAGIARDIEAMPMGMATMLSEGGGGISGGQKQRILIARAIANEPRILMFDEATSALDNLSQKQVSDALDNMKSTRIVIAHRLSTIRMADQILVMDQGKIVEQGTYDELIEKNGLFKELVEHQQIDKK